MTTRSRSRRGGRSNSSRSDSASAAATAPTATVSSSKNKSKKKSMENKMEYQGERIEDMTVKTLKKALKALNIPMTGLKLKHEFQQRLVDSLQQATYDDDQQEDSDVDDAQQQYVDQADAHDSEEDQNIDNEEEKKSEEQSQHNDSSLVKDDKGVLRYKDKPVKSMKVAELKQALKQLGLPTDGLKAVLLQRLFDAGEENSAVEMDSMAEGLEKKPNATPSPPRLTGPKSRKSLSPQRVTGPKRSKSPSPHVPRSVDRDESESEKEEEEEEEELVKPIDTPRRRRTGPRKSKIGLVEFPPPMIDSSDDDDASENHQVHRKRTGPRKSKVHEQDLPPKVVDDEEEEDVITFKTSNTRKGKKKSSPAKKEKQQVPEQQQNQVEEDNGEAREEEVQQEEDVTPEFILRPEDLGSLSGAKLKDYMKKLELKGTSAKDVLATYFTKTFPKMKVKELKVFLEIFGLKLSGSKAILIERIKEHIVSDKSAKPSPHTKKKQATPPRGKQPSALPRTPMVSSTLLAMGPREITPGTPVETEQHEDALENSLASSSSFSSSKKQKKRTLSPQKEDWHIVKDILSASPAKRSRRETQETAEGGYHTAEDDDDEEGEQRIQRDLGKQVEELIEPINTLLEQDESELVVVETVVEKRVLSDSSIARTPSPQKKRKVSMTTTPNDVEKTPTRRKENSLDSMIAVAKDPQTPSNVIGKLLEDIDITDEDFEKVDAILRAMVKDDAGGDGSDQDVVFSSVKKKKKKDKKSEKKKKKSEKKLRKSEKKLKKSTAKKEKKKRKKSMMADGGDSDLDITFNNATKKSVTSSPQMVIPETPYSEMKPAFASHSKPKWRDSLLSYSAGVAPPPASPFGMPVRSHQGGGLATAPRDFYRQPNTPGGFPRFRSAVHVPSPAFPSKFSRHPGSVQQFNERRFMAPTSFASTHHEATRKMESFHEPTQVGKRILETIQTDKQQQQRSQGMYGSQSSSSTYHGSNGTPNTMNRYRLGLNNLQANKEETTKSQEPMLQKQILENSFRSFGNDKKPEKKEESVDSPVMFFTKKQGISTTSTTTPTFAFSPAKVDSKTTTKEPVPFDPNLEKQYTFH